MAVQYHTVNHQLFPAEREYLEAELERVAAHLRNFPAPSWHVEVERSPRKGGFGVSVHVNLSTRSLFANAWGGDLRAAAESVSDKLVRQAKRHVELLRKDEHAGAESARRPEREWTPTAEDLETVRDLEDFSDRIAHHAARLHRVLRREFGLDPRAKRCGGAVSVPDVVEDAIAYVYEHFREKPKDLSPDRWLVRRGLIFLDAELDRVAHDAEPMPEARIEPQEDWEELLDLPVLELLPLDGRPVEAGRARPDLVQDQRQARMATANALRRLPTRIRTALVLRHLEGYRIPEIAFVLNSDEAQVMKWLDEGEVRLREQLGDWRPA